MEPVSNGGGLVPVANTNPVNAVPVGASKLAMVANDNAGRLTPRGAPPFFASMLAPTGC
jgi:hypothetical protein